VIATLFLNILFQDDPIEVTNDNYKLQYFGIIIPIKLCLNVCYSKLGCIAILLNNVRTCLQIQFVRLHRCIIINLNFIRERFSLINLRKLPIRICLVLKLIIINISLEGLSIKTFSFWKMLVFIV
jgi:hypothetical protein